MRHHHPRQSSLRTLELINEALVVYQAMADHARDCNECNDEGLCPTAEEMYVKVKETSSNLKRLGIDTGYTP